MTRQLNKNCRIIITHPAGNSFFGKSGNQVTIEGLRVQFEISLSNSKTPNHCDLTITNLNKNSRAEFQMKPLIVTIEGGYDGEYQHIFTGDLRYGSSKLDPPDWETKLQLADGDRAFRSAKVNKSYTSKTPVLTALKDVAGSMGLTVPTDTGSNGLLQQFQTQYKSGTAIDGNSRDEMTRLLAPYGAHWSIQNSKLVIQRETDLTPGTLRVISAKTGMKGSPEAGAPERPGSKKGNTVTVKVKMTLTPDLYPGQVVQIQSKEITGNFKIKTVKHKGDTHGDDWESEVEGTAV